MHTHRNQQWSTVVCRRLYSNSNIVAIRWCFARWKFYIQVKIAFSKKIQNTIVFNCKSSIILNSAGFGSFETGNHIKQQTNGYHKKVVVPRLSHDGTKTGELETADIIVQSGSYSYIGNSKSALKNKINTNLPRSCSNHIDRQC